MLTSTQAILLIKNLIDGSAPGSFTVKDVKDLCEHSIKGKDDYFWDEYYRQIFGGENGDHLKGASVIEE